MACFAVISGSNASNAGIIHAAEGAGSVVVLGRIHCVFVCFEKISRLVLWAERERERERREEGQEIEDRAHKVLLKPFLEVRGSIKGKKFARNFKELPKFGRIWPLLLLASPSRSV